MDDTLGHDQLGQGDYTIFLDVAKVYWHVPTDKKRTGIHHSKKIVSIQMTPFRLCRAPATFQQMTHQVVRGCTILQVPI